MTRDKMPNRREVISTLVVLPLASLAACADDAADPDGAGGGATGTGGADGAGGAGGTGQGGVGGGSSSTGPGTDWASGGTSAMDDPDAYPDPFADDLVAPCAPMPAATLGPCYAATLERRDISEGRPGLPVRLALRIVDGGCAPRAGVVVDVWHTSNRGLYSGDDAAAACTLGDEDAIAARYFRGTQTTDAEGRVAFDTCYPGWYGGRTIHFHVSIREGAATLRTTQLFFEQALTQEIFAAHPDYAPSGQPDTTNQSDAFYFVESVLETERMLDGAMLAHGTIAV